MWIIAVGIVIALMCGYCFPLVNFIKHLDNMDTCSECGADKDCVILRETHHGRSNFVSDWMLISYLMVRKHCMWTREGKRAHRCICVLLGFLLYISLCWSRGFQYDGVLMGCTAVMLLFLSIVDWNTQFIPMECNIIILICGLIRLFADVSNWKEYLIGLIAVSGFLCIVNYIATPILKRKYPEDEIDSVIGDGDIKLMAATGLLLGWKLNFLALGIGCVTGSVIHQILMKIKGGERQFAFGPYLSLGLYITMICGEQLVSWYLNIMGLYPIQ